MKIIYGGIYYERTINYSRAICYSYGRINITTLFVKILKEAQWKHWVFFLPELEAFNDLRVSYLQD